MKKKAFIEKKKKDSTKQIRREQTAFRAVSNQKGRERDRGRQAGRQAGR